jgi:hypothetical protein
MEPMSLRAYARHRGVCLRAVQKALKSGRIAAREDGRLDPDVADANWASNTAPRPQPASTPTTGAVAPVKSAASPQTIHHHSASPIPTSAREPSEQPRLESGLEYSKAQSGPGELPGAIGEDRLRRTHRQAGEPGRNAR